MGVIEKVFTFMMSGLVGMYSHQWSESMRIVGLVMSIVFVIISAYLLGSLNFAIIISGKQYKQDIRNYGSNNAGMTNMMRTYGKKAAALTLIGDALKAVVSCLIGYVLVGQMGAYIAGLFCIVGHIFPAYYHFKGGKGVVTAGVTILMCNPIVFLILIIMFVIIVLFTKYISLGSVMCMLIYPFLLDRIDRILFNSNGSVGVIFAVIMTVLIVFKHASNIKRLLNGTENKFSFKKSVKEPAKESENADTQDSEKK